MHKFTALCLMSQAESTAVTSVRLLPHSFLTVAWCKFKSKKKKSPPPKHAKAPVVKFCFIYFVYLL